MGLVGDAVGCVMDRLNMEPQNEAVTINYKFELFEGPLELLLSLVEKHKMKIDDIPIDLLCEQYIAYIKEAERYNIDLACEFLYMASELMLIKSRMLLPRDPVKDEDPRKPLADAMREYQRAKLAASELSEMFGEYGGRMVKEQDDISKDKKYVAEHSVELLSAALIHVLTETKMTEKTVREKFTEIVNAPRIPVGELMTSLISSLREADIFLDKYFAHSANRSEMIGKFIGILELIKSRIVIVVEDENISCTEDGVTDMASHARLTLIGTDEDIRTASLDSYM